jgi:hypothetical protein
VCDDGRDNDCDELVDCDDDDDCALHPACASTNDVCAGAIDVSRGGTFLGTTRGYEDDYQPIPDGAECAGGAGPDGVFYFVTREPLAVSLDTFGSDFDTVLYVRADDCERGLQVGCNDDTDGFQSEVFFDILPPGVHYVFVDGYGDSSEGSYELHVWFGDPGGEVCDDDRDNDGDRLIDCDDPDCEAHPACRCIPEPEFCWDGEDNDCDGLMDCDDDEDCATDPACCEPRPEICDDGIDNDCDRRVDCDDPNCSRDPACAGPNDTCMDAIDVSRGGEFAGSTIGYDDTYTPVTGPPDCAGGDGSDAVFFFILSGPTSVSIDTFGSDFDTVLYVRESLCVRGEQIECNDDSGGLQSSVYFDRLDRGRYFIFVDGFGDGEAGNYLLHVEFGGVPGEVCDDGRDNDGDRLIDCDDPDCDDDPFCFCVPEPELGTRACADGRDNDCDGLTDCDDEEDCAVMAEFGECCDGRDDNGNGFVDELACHCLSDRDCLGAIDVCYLGTADACAPRCDAIGGDPICDVIFPGTRCDAATGRCVR